MSMLKSDVVSKFQEEKEKELSIDDIYDLVEKCEKCELKKLSVNREVVRSNGRLNAPIMIIAQNPSESRKGNRCFGEDDSVNSKYIQAMLEKHKFNLNDVYITNLVKCSTKNNLRPNENITKICSEYIKEEINVVNPKLIICAGRFSSDYFGLSFYEIKRSKNRIFFSIYHPSYISYGKCSKEEYINQLNPIKDTLKKIRNRMFVHLHCHDEYSIRDAIGKIEDYVELAKERNLPAICITNHGNIGGFIRQYLACKQMKIKPIFGCELYVNNYRKVENKKDLPVEKRKNNHLIVLAKNIEGFKNIVKITSDAWINGFYYRPRTDFKFLESCSKGIIATSGCLAGKLNKFLLEDKWDKARNFVEKYKQIFEEFYIELIMIDFDLNIEINEKLVKLAKETDTKLIITGDVHYLKKEYSKIHNIMLLIRDNYTLKDLEDEKKKDKIFQFEAKDLYYKTIEDVYDLFNKKYKSNLFTKEVFIEAFDNVFELINSIENIELDTSLKLPKISENSDQILKNKLLNGFKKRGFSKNKNKDYFERMKHEYDVITKSGFTDYFLIMEDIVNWAKNNNIIVGPGRGSAAGCLISYLLRITEIDPIKYGLLFERFYSEGRKDIPDIDTDFEPRYRDDVKEYIIERFGEKNVCTIGTYGIFKARSTLLDIARVYSIPLHETLHLTKNIMTSECDTMTFKEIKEEFPAVEKYFENYPEVIDICEVIRGQIRNMSKHAAGMIISDRDLSNNIALMSRDKKVFSAWQEGSDYHELSALGFIKFDILGLNNLSVIKDCIDIIKERHDIEIDMYNIPMDDKKSLKLAEEADTYGIFQFESRISRDLLKRVKPNCFMDLSHTSSLLRPGPLRAGVSDEFANRKNDKVHYSIPKQLKEILEETYGIIIYQEQIMLIAQKIGGFDLKESNSFRKALVKYGKGEKVESERYAKVRSYKNKFIKNAVKILSKNEALDLWEKMASFAAYGFNRSHSISYAMISYIEFYLKANYFIEFVTALLNNTSRGKETNQKDRTLKVYINYARERGIKVINPDVNKSMGDFSIIDNDIIIFGFNHIKNTGNICKDIIEARPYSSLKDFCNKLKGRKVNKTKVESLIYSGAFDNFGNRNELIKEYNTEINVNKKYEHIDLNKLDLIQKETDMMNICLSDSIFPDNIKKIIDNSKNFFIPSYFNKKGLEEGSVAGMLNKIVTSRIKSGKRIGEKYYRLVISDDTDSIRINVFNNSDVLYVSKYLKESMFVAISSISLHVQSGSYNISDSLNSCLKVLEI